MTDVKLTRQSEEILARLRADVARGHLTEDQVKFVVKCMELKESVGVLANVIIKAAALVAAIAAIWAFIPWGGQK